MVEISLYIGGSIGRTNEGVKRQIECGERVGVAEDSQSQRGRRCWREWRPLTAFGVTLKAFGGDTTNFHAVVAGVTL